MLSWCKAVWPESTTIHKLRNETTCTELELGDDAPSMNLEKARTEHELGEGTHRAWMWRRHAPSMNLETECTEHELEDRTHRA
ncbi:unnamed protein product [Citrullus colocynthis]|uniref:Uncharacterized protein n=1 Tax=Citrullus colocynthis TaxID=252529 RepID=A0ABP0YGC5_9ROSI